MNKFKNLELSQNLNNSTHFLLFDPDYLSKKYYQNILAYDLILKQNYTTIMQLPCLEKIILNTSSKNYVNDKKNSIPTLAAFQLISGQKAQLTFARKSIANFKLRQHQILGCKVVLHKNQMYMFLDKLAKIIFPRIRDYSKKQSHLKLFKNLTPYQSSLLINNKKSTRNSISHSIGFTNPMIFPELENHFELVDYFRGVNCTFVVSNSTPQTSLLLLSGFQLPLIKF